jgi:hypothetical protein
MVAKSYKACFHWFIDDIALPEGGLDILVNKKGTEEAFNAVFTEAYNRGVDALNEHYEEWNKEYDTLMDKKSSEDDMNYNRFISQKQNEILKKIPDDVFELFTDPEFGECSICGRLKHVHNKDVKVQFTLKAV